MTNKELLKAIRDYYGVKAISIRSNIKAGLEITPNNRFKKFIITVYIPNK